MAGRGRPFLFCRYELSIGGDRLDGEAQLSTLKMLQGQAVAYGRRAREQSLTDTQIFRPRAVSGQHNHPVISWSLKQDIHTRQVARHDTASDNPIFEFIRDGSIRYTDFVACPELGVLAVDDRTGDVHIGGKAAISRFKHVFREINEGEADIMLTVTPQDVDRALQQWDLTNYSFVIRPINPHAPSLLSERFSDAMKAEGVAEFKGSMKPAPGHHMKPDEGPIAATSEIASAGYGQVAVKGVTDGGISAEIKKPKFHPDKTRNQTEQSKLRELRVFVDADGLTDEEVFDIVGHSLNQFYGNDDATP